MTKPIDDLLPLPMEPKAKPFMDFYHEALHELVCFGTHILSWSLQQGKGKEDQRNEIDLAVPLLFRHILELVDAISVQIKLGVAAPCKVQLRALLEAQLSLEYMLEKDRPRRAACYLITDFYRKLSFYKKMMSGTPESKKLIEELKDHSLTMSDFTAIPEAAMAAKNMEELIAKPIYAEVNNEYTEVLKKKGNSEIKWYSLFNGPNNVKWLAQRLKKYETYVFFHQAWSDSTHGTGLTQGVLVKGENGYGAITQLRNMEGAHEVVTQTMLLTLQVYIELMAKKVVSEKKKEISAWQFWFRDTYRTKVDERKIEWAR